MSTIECESPSTAVEPVDGAPMLHHADARFGIFTMISGRAAVFVHVNARCLAIAIGCDYEEACRAGEMAYLQATKDGEATAKGYMSRGAKIYVRREMLRAAAPARMVYASQIPDFGYVDGRTTKRGARRPAKDKQSRHRQKMISLGLCRICGQAPLDGLTLCPRCRCNRQEIVRRRNIRLRGREYTREDIAVAGELHRVG